jgi:hypothetical protein
MNQLPTPTNAEEIGQRVLKLVENIHGRDDIAPARIEQLTGIKVEFNPDDANEYGFSGQLTEQWAYNLVSLPEGRHGADLCARFRRLFRRAAARRLRIECGKRQARPPAVLGFLAR